MIPILLHRYFAEMNLEWHIVYFKEENPEQNCKLNNPLISGINSIQKSKW